MYIKSTVDIKFDKSVCLIFSLSKRQQKIGVKFNHLLSRYFFASAMN